MHSEIYSTYIYISIFSLFPRCECHLRLVLKCPEAKSDISKHKFYGIMKFKVCLFYCPLVMF